jgi:hypothetical protein
VRRTIVSFAVGSALMAIAVALLAGGRAEPPVPMEGLPPATVEPDCPVGRGVGAYHVTWVEGSGFPTAREALVATLRTAKWHLGSSSGFTGRYVQVADGKDSTLGREFTLMGSDGALEVMGLAVWQPDGGWLVSGLTQCYLSPHGEAGEDS